MTTNQLLALKPGDRVKVWRYGDYGYVVRDMDIIRSQYYKPMYGVRLIGLHALYLAADIEHYTEPQS